MTPHLRIARERERGRGGSSGGTHPAAERSGRFRFPESKHEPNDLFVGVNPVLWRFRFPESLGYVPESPRYVQFVGVVFLGLY